MIINFPLPDSFTLNLQAYIEEEVAFIDSLEIKNVIQDFTSTNSEILEKPDEFLVESQEEPLWDILVAHDVVVYFARFQEYSNPFLVNENNDKQIVSFLFGNTHDIHNEGLEQGAMSKDHSHYFLLTDQQELFVYTLKDPFFIFVGIIRGSEFYCFHDQRRWFLMVGRIITDSTISTMIFIARVRGLSRVFRVMPWSWEDQGIPK
jgi:hypothetical protein